MTDNKLDQILQELYQADPALRQHDAVLRKLVVDMMASRPDVQMDESFKVGLRMKLAQLNQTQEIKPSLISNFMNSFKLVGAGAALAAVLFAGAWYFNSTNNGGSSSFVVMTNKLNITKSSANAFGSLASLQQAGGQGGGGGNAASMESTTDAGVTNSAPGAGGGSDRMMIAPENPVNFRYVYNGEPLTLTQEQVEVLKRQKNTNPGGLSEFISRITFGLVNFGSFTNTQLESFTFKEDRSMGYIVNVNVAEGNVNIHENWPRWEALTMPAGRRVDISEVPADSVIIDAANAFLDTHGIDRNVYGTPVVNADWRVYYDATPNKADYWIPEVMNVVFPVMINGQQVHDESGNPSGLNVGVRISPEVRVTGVWELTTQNYEASAYQAETNVDRIMSLVERGGFRNYYYAAEGATTVDVEVGAPEVSYVKLWNYKSGVNEELLVPALIFPVLDQPSQDIAPGYWQRKNVVIPLVKEILDNENIDLPVRIMPAEEPSVDGEVVNPTNPAADDSNSMVDPIEPAVLRNEE